VIDLNEWGKDIDLCDSFAICRKWNSETLDWSLSIHTARRGVHLCAGSDLMTCLPCVAGVLSACVSCRTAPDGRLTCYEGKLEGAFGHRTGGGDGGSSLASFCRDGLASLGVAGGTYRSWGVEAEALERRARSFRVRGC
jgi:hypothetical protein